MYHILIDTPEGEKEIGKVSNHSEFMKLLNQKQVKTIMDHNAYQGIEKLFVDIKKKKTSETYIHNVGGINISVIANQDKIIHTLVFYL